MTTPAITTRAQLIDALRLAAELEHGLMCQYLFAAYSLKRYPYECWDGPEKTQELMTQAELERVRRWAMKIALIARQEMEHLGLALNMLSAIGGTPSFSRPNMPQREHYYGEACIKLELTRCNLATIERFQAFEAPDHLSVPCELVDQQAAIDHCRQPGVPPDEVFAAFLQDKDSGLLQGAPHIDQYGVPYKNVQELYQSVADGFTHVSTELGESNLFIGNPGNQVFGGPASPLYGQMNDLNQYGLSLIAVTDLTSALTAIRMIIEQGEGASVPPNYLPNTHFCLFTSIRTEMQADASRLAEIGTRPVAPNPMVRLQPDVPVPDEVTLIRNANTRAVAELFNESYEVMLLLLLYLYSDQNQSTDQTNSLMDAAFFPFMTMFIRPLAEILTQLPVDEDPNVTAGPGFELAGDVILLPNLPETWTMFQERLDTLQANFRKVTARRPLPPPEGHPLRGRDPVKPVWGWVPLHDPWLALPWQEFPEVVAERTQAWEKIKQEGTTIWPDEETLAANAAVGEPFTANVNVPPSLPWLRLYYLRQNMERMAVNWANNWTNVGRTS
ncbi:MAG TPA: ferritin-like domain-containing protein [Thermoanaerobaculia bacterium]|jgi:hypothetical protein